MNRREYFEQNSPNCSGLLSAEKQRIITNGPNRFSSCAYFVFITARNFCHFFFKIGLITKICCDLSTTRWTVHPTIEFHWTQLNCSFRAAFSGMQTLHRSYMVCVHFNFNDGRKNDGIVRLTLQIIKSSHMMVFVVLPWSGAIRSAGQTNDKIIMFIVGLQ